MMCAENLKSVQVGRKSLRLVVVAGVASLTHGVAAGEDRLRYSTDLTASSGLFDRGEQIGAETLEFSAAAEKKLGGVTAYAAFYRLLPVGSDQAAFDDEADYTLGVVLEGEAVSADLSANWLTYPGEAADASLELASEFGFDAPLSPGVIGFYDANLDDWGLEAFFQPRMGVGDWTLYALGRTGFVVPGNGSANRSYVGIEFGASRPLVENAELGFFARADVADEAAFADEIDSGVITRTHNSGLAVGMSLSLAH